jgi:hypothetical protein
MPALDRLLQNAGMTAEAISRLRQAYELALREIGVKDRDDPLTATIAKAIVEASESGPGDPVEICKLARSRLGI